MTISIATYYRDIASIPDNQSTNEPGEGTAPTALDALSSARIVAENPQTMVTNAVTAASDVCKAVCMATGAIAGAGIGFAIGSAPGAEKGFEYGFIAGTIAGEGICDGGGARCNDVPPATSVGPDAGAPDASAPPPPPGGGTTDDQTTGGYELTNGGVESNAGKTDSSGSVDQSEPTTSSDGSVTSGVCDPSAGVCPDGVDSSSGGSGLPADDGGDGRSNPLTPFNGRSLTTLTSDAGLLTAELETKAQLASLGSAIRA